jgi:hypothetical protein
MVAAVLQAQSRPGRDTTRPLSEAVSDLQRRTDVILTYEDPLLSFKDDIVDVTASVRQDGELTKRVLVARGPKVDLVDPGGDPRDAARAIVSKFNREVSSMQFKLNYDGDRVVHVVPATARDAEGNLTAARAPLDTLVALPAERLPLHRVVQLILDQVTEISRTPSYLGSAPQLLFDDSVTVAVDAGMSVPARTAVTRALLSVDSSLSWSFLCSPKPPSGECALNIRRVTENGARRR